MKLKEVRQASMEPTVISFYTENTPYTREIEDLVTSCQKWHMRYSIDSLPHFGSWEKNCCFKPKYILKKLKCLHTPVLWLDADAIVWKKPSFASFEGTDLALHSNPSLPMDHPSKVNSGTLLFYPTQNAFDFLKAWDLETERLLQIDPSPWDQISLRNTLLQSQAKVHFLDSRHCRIVTQIKTQQELNESFFIHFQASRTLKKLINLEVIPFWDETAYIDYKKRLMLLQNV